MINIPFEHIEDIEVASLVEHIKELETKILTINKLTAYQSDQLLNRIEILENSVVNYSIENTKLQVKIEELEALLTSEEKDSKELAFDLRDYRQRIKELEAKLEAWEDAYTSYKPPEVTND